MAKTKLVLNLDSALMQRVDKLVACARYANRSQAIEAAIAEKLARMAHTRLADECAKLDPEEERRFADEGWGTAATWPTY